MKRFTLVALLAAALAGCDDIPFHDEGVFRGHGHEHGHGHHDDFGAAEPAQAHKAA